ncbi:PREDICTED: uncharacterized protein LOC105360517 isoform X1 [Ceratosolen solmsi marchali]|uniref:Uncharacterized protein LOC105360517 isoform X1 n=1 Tax=Ceratosolen solmsi marchali TaxID=326594 RepID=A0AAJ6YCS8_9HYME|nr:PREDICTED: uncharacterized protein LOC105360517 isoform X1 [Ceratosolen solmsi marchali]
MKSTVTDPWSCTDTCGEKKISESCSSFEDSFVSTASNLQELTKLPDSEEYLARLCKFFPPHSRLKSIQGGTSKQDLINSLSSAKEDCIARLITNGHNLETAEERELATNPLIRHIAPHLQALTANELVHLLKADVLQAVVDEQKQIIKDIEDKSLDSSLDNKDNNGL